MVTVVSNAKAVVTLATFSNDKMERLVQERMKLPLLGAIVLGIAVSVCANLLYVLIRVYFFDSAVIDMPYVALRTLLLAPIFTFLFWDRPSVK